MVKYTTALDPHNENIEVTSLGDARCSALQRLPDQDPNCPDEEKGADILWAYQDNYGSNDRQSKPGGDAYGDDRYGFVMLDGPPGSVDSAFESSYTVARSLQEHEAAAAGLVKRSLLTANRTRIETAFEYASERPWRGKVRRAKSSHDRMRKRQTDIMSGSGSGSGGGVTRLDERDNELLESESMSPRAKRWFGSSIDWIAKVTTVEKNDAGFLTMAVQKSILLYRAFVGCSRTNAHMSIYLDAEEAMDATYANYYSGTLGGVVPTATYAYFAMQPHIYLGLAVTGGARLEYRSPRAKLLPTLSYPGLAIKVLAAVGPTLDVWGQIVGVVQISGTMQAGARYTFEQAEMYWPDDGAAAPVLQGLAAVSASVDLDINVTPEARLGIQIGGGSAFGVALVDAQVVGYVNNTLRFHADVTGTVSSSTGSAEVAYNYGVYLLYNIGYGGWASI
ncbi:hypothetical protein C8A05DRAFT_40082, partial [Staphylotrichum tortipilum]